MKKIVLMFAGAILSFLILSYIDEYENLVMPFVASPTSDNYTTVSPDGMNEDIRDMILAFNRGLARAHFTSDPSLLNQLSIIDDSLRPSLAGEIAYLAREGKIMDINVKELNVDKVQAVSPQTIQVYTKETVGLRYLSSATGIETVIYPDAQYSMRYTVRATGGELKIAAFETMSVKGRSLE